MRIKSITAATIAQCLIQAKMELGSDAVILSKRTVRKGGFFGLGGKNMIEVTFGVSEEREQTNSTYIQKLESQIATLSTSVQALVDSSGKRKAADYPPVGAIDPDGMIGDFISRRGRGKGAEPAPDAYASLTRQLLESDVAAPLVRQLISEIPSGLTTATATSELRTLLSQKLLIANRIEIQPGGKLRVLAFVGTTGVGKTTTIAKLAAQYSLVERRKVGVITMDTQRIAAAQQLQTYGEILRVPVRIAHDKAEMVAQLSDFARDGMELVLLDTAGRSPNDMLPLGETAQLFEGVGVVQKFLAVPATLSPRDMDNVVGRFYNMLSPDALILTKLDEATDSACFGKLLTVQAKYGIPLAYVTTGQKVPDDIAFPDSHAIAARILSTAIL